jgi:hypothetical protein
MGKLLRRWMRWCFYPMLMALLAAACGGDGAGGSFAIADADKQSYRMDCGQYCDAAARCGGQASEACQTSCQQQVAAGALQSGYLDQLYDCVTGLAAPCNSLDLDGCLSAAQTQCSPAAGLDAFVADYCELFLSCQDYDPAEWLDGCIQDVEAMNDYRVYRCSSDAALDKLGQCAAAADCDQLVAVALLDLCGEVYE